jgi:hypothetical protein
MDQHANEHDDAVESTPLLVDEAESEAMDGADVEQRQRDESTSAADARSAKIALRLHTAALTIGIITLGLVIGILIVLGFRLTPPDYERPWLVERSAGDIVFSVCFCLFPLCFIRLPHLTSTHRLFAALF